MLEFVKQFDPGPLLPDLGVGVRVDRTGISMPIWPVPKSIERSTPAFTEVGGNYFEPAAFWSGRLRG